jgi:tRNA threonylcarbamoyladenosine biosynthesis protein TsaE
MTPPILLELDLATPEATDRMGAALAARLEPGDTVLLDGAMGSGKTRLARAMIRSLMEVPEEVPSPTFTLMQLYETRLGEVVHADLYRLGGSGGLDDIGLSDALGVAVCLIEWPDRLGDLVPADALTVTLLPAGGDDARRAVLKARSARWGAVLDGLGDAMDRAA